MIKKFIFQYLNKILERSFDVRLEKVKKQINHVKEERLYWENVINDYYKKYDLKMHPLQNDDSIVPPKEILKKVQCKNHASPDYFFSQGYYDAYTYFNALEKYNVNLNSEQSILDFGVGFGRLLINWFPFNVSLYGCDITPEAVSWSKQNYSDRAEIIHTNQEPPLPYTDDTFDIIYSNAVFIHIPYSKQDQWISELKRISKPGGYVLVTYYEPSVNLNNWARREVHEKLTKPEWYEMTGNVNLNYEGVNTFIERDLILKKWSNYFVPLEYIPRFKKHSLLIVKNENCFL